MLWGCCFGTLMNHNHDCDNVDHGVSKLWRKPPVDVDWRLFRSILVY